MKLISIWNGLYRTVLTNFFSKVKTKPIFVSRQWTKMLKNGRWCSYGRDVHITYAPDWSITKFKFLVKMSLRCNSQWSMQRLLLSFCGQILNILCVLNSINHLKVEEFQAKYYSSQVKLFFMGTNTIEIFLLLLIFFSLFQLMSALKLILWSSGNIGLVMIKHWKQFCCALLNNFRQLHLKIQVRYALQVTLYVGK